MFGTIPVDLEAHKIIDLLPDRTADGVAGWLARAGCQPETKPPGAARGCYALAAICKGGGMANAAIIERLD